jgi:DNA-binding GntR family transcriptional regulator
LRLGHSFRELRVPVGTFPNWRYRFTHKMINTKSPFDVTNTDDDANLLAAPVHPISLVNDVADRFRRSFINGSIKPGDEINELQLAERLSVSRGTLREAIRILVGEGLLEKLPNRKARVRTLSSSKFWEIMTTRAIIEGFAARLLAERLTPEKRARLDEIWQALNQAADANDRTLFSNWDFTFHRAIVEMSEHELLLETWTKMSAWILLMFAAQEHTRADMVPNAVNHQGIVQAIASGDPDFAEKKLKDDLLNQPEVQRMNHLSMHPEAVQTNGK